MLSWRHHWRTQMKERGFNSPCPSKACKIACGRPRGALLECFWALSGPSWGPRGSLLRPSAAILEPA
eukprot:1152303-Pyramimonas_sp.AAC.1